MINRIILGIVCSILLSCSNEKQIAGNYYDISFESGEDRTISYKQEEGFFVDVIPAAVESYCVDKEYILAKRNVRKFPEKPNFKNVEFYIIPLRGSTNRVDKNFIGPLSKKELQTVCLERNIDFKCLQID